MYRLHIMLLSLLAQGTFQAQGFDRISGQFQAQGQWQVQQERGRWWFSARGQQTMPVLGVVEFAFDSYLINSAQMALNEQFPTGDEIASVCQRSG